MRRGVVALMAVVTATLSLGATLSRAADRYPVSIGFSYGNWSPSMDRYNVRFIGDNNPTFINGAESRIRWRLDTIDSTIILLSDYPQRMIVGRTPYLFTASKGFGANARIRLHSEVFALVEYDVWKQSVASARNFGAFIGYEQFDISLSPITASLVYQLPTEGTGGWWPNLFIGGGGGAVVVKRTSTQVTNASPIGGSVVAASGSGVIYNGLVGLDFCPPILQERFAFFVEAKFIGGDFQEAFPVLGPQGQALKDPADPNGRTDLVEMLPVSVQGPQFKAGMTFSFGQIRVRPTKGVLSGLIESRNRRGGYAMAPAYGVPGPAMAGGGVAAVYPQPSEQVQVIQGSGQVDEDRIRQVVREELMNARMTSGEARPVDDLAEEQLRSIRQRRLQAEQELEQLKELLREEG